VESRDRITVPQVPVESENVALLAHELRRRMAALRIMGEAMAVTSARGGDLGTLIVQLMTELDDLESLALDLLQDRPGSRALQEVDLLEVAHKAVDVVSGARGVEVEFTHPSEPVPVRTVELLLRQALENLLDNAVRYGHRPTVELRVERTRLGDRYWVKIEVLDDGPGFGSAQAAERRGSGIGLAFVERLVDAVGGRCTRVDRAEGGTRLQLLLPEAPGADDHRRRAVVHASLDTFNRHRPGIPTGEICGNRQG
jgi:signal transduction histidine kinase